MNIDLTGIWWFILQRVCFLGVLAFAAGVVWIIGWMDTDDDSRAE